MLIDALTGVMERSKALENFWGKIDAQEDASLGVASSARPFLVAASFERNPRPTLVVIAGEEAADTFARNLTSYIGEERVLRFFERSDYPFVPKSGDPSQIACRMEAIHALVSGKKQVVVASARSLLRCLPPAEAKAFAPLSFFAQRELDEMGNEGIETLDDCIHALELQGYVNTGELEGPGSFCVRGGAIDVFPGNLVYPVRLDFFGDELDEIRRIVPSTGQTISDMGNVDVYPVQEFVLSSRSAKRAREKLANSSSSNPALRRLFENLEGGVRFEGADALLPLLYASVSTLGDYLKSEVLTVLIEPRSLFDDATHAYEDITGRAKGTNIAVEGLYLSPSELGFGANQRATYLSIMQVGSTVDDELPVKRVEIAGNEEKLFGKLRSLVDGGYTVVFSVPAFRARQDMKFELVDRSLPITEVLDVNDTAPNKLKKGIVNIVDVDIALGMIIPKAKLALVSISDTQGSTALRRGRRIDITEITFPYKPGDYVVHAAHGVAFFKELVRQDTGGVARDYLLLEYAENDKLYVPVEQLDRVTRYVGPEGSSPRLTRLNTADWSRALGKARKATKQLAFDLVDVYTRRAATQGYRYSADTPEQRVMEESFPYQETPDQLAAIADVKADMQSGKPMDRLVCGDVGFGKTEVALRAAFKATQDKKQVMVLCPTTILAQQHFTNFKERFDPFGIRVEVLSRFRTEAQQKKTLEAFSDGEVNVLVGTHRLLSRDVNPHDLGLVIVDEEQRFGVGHKEQLKNLRESIDILTLSATPIPRTMQMSLSGVRDMSLILTPPDDRHPVEVFVGEWDPDIVSGAIRRELARKGQIYYVSNRVRSIDEAVKRVNAAVGEARVGIAHGKMSKEQLEHVMEDFSAGELDVLVATTIIESGIDNPHTNTLIIEDSQRLGLAQLYQLKGRVGRSSTQAYAYFMFPEHMSLTEEAASRLTAVHEHTELGSGMRIAMRDLEIRGAGSLLGAEQSGNMSAVGFDLFAQMLATAVNATREGNLKAMDSLPPALSDISINVPAHTYVPEEYIPDTDERVLLYRKVAAADSVWAVDELFEATIVRRPEMPQATRNFFEKARIKAYANEKKIKTISVVGGKLSIDPLTLSRAQQSSLRRYGGRYLEASKKLSLPLRYFKLGEEESILDAIWQFLRELFDETEAK